MNYKNFIKQLIPPLIINLLNKSKGIKFSGDFGSWNEAMKLCSGYQHEDILDKVTAATEKVVKGQAAFERDSILFYEEEYNWPLLTGLFKAASENNNKLCVLDFGGALGSTYFQNRKLLSGIHELKWCVVEQEHFVKRGQEKFQSDVLKFYYDIESCIEENPINVVLFSSVLQYLDTPFAYLTTAINYNCDYIIVDRLLVNENAENDRICVQKVPDSLYSASYPMWVFSKEKFIENLNSKYNLIFDFDAISGKFDLQRPKAQAFDKGFVFKRKDNVS